MAAVSSTFLPNANTKQDIHLFESMARCLNGGPGGPEQFAGAVMTHYVDRITAFLHVHRFERDMNSYLALCSLWIRALLTDTDPLANTPMAFSRDDIVINAREGVYGTAVSPMTTELSQLDDVFNLLETMLREDAAKLKQTAVIPREVPVAWEDSIRDERIVPSLRITASAEETKSVYGERLDAFFAETARVRDCLEQSSHLDILDKLDTKAQMQYAKLATARGLFAG
jgi:hypothetical protein